MKETLESKGYTPLTFLANARKNGIRDAIRIEINKSKVSAMVLGAGFLLTLGFQESLYNSQGAKGPLGIARKALSDSIKEHYSLQNPCSYIFPLHNDQCENKYLVEGTQ